MEILFAFAILFYMLSSAGYFSFLVFQKAILQKTGLILIIAGFACHTITIGYDFISSGHIPVNNLFETLSIATWTFTCVFLVFQHHFRLNILGVYAAPLISLTLIWAYQLPKFPMADTALFKSFWLITHIVTIFTGDASLALACGISILYLLQERAIKTKSRGFFFKRLPSLELLDNTGYAAIVFGFTMLTIGLITGMVYAKSVWSHFWSWDPKEVWSAIAWAYYAILLHERLAVGWRGRKAAIMAIFGFLVLIFTFLGVNFFMEGHHGRFTQI
ncbi:MAG: c-type cytochrome biogenesis protein CcsB [Desulfobacteraceae bacterium]|jgi:cytochrome c-type biogenesis protein CcsB